MTTDVQHGLFGELEGDFTVRADKAKRALDILFEDARRYRTSEEYADLLRFIGRFRFYSPFNAMLVYTQMPGATYVATPGVWKRDYGRSLRPGARPLVILKPKGPVMFVFDVSDTEAGEGAAPLPAGVERPFDAAGEVGRELELTIANARRDGVRTELRSAGTQSAGEIRSVCNAGSMSIPTSAARNARQVTVPVRYELLLNGGHARAGMYATLVHELGHLYCGHLGSPNQTWWPSRSKADADSRELEAESVCYLVCERRMIDNPSAGYLAGFIQEGKAVPAISLDAVVRAAGMVEAMGRAPMRPRDWDPPF